MVCDSFTSNQKVFILESTISTWNINGGYVMSLVCLILGHKYKRETILVKKCTRCGEYIKQNIFDSDGKICKVKLSKEEAEEEMKYDRENVVSLLEARLEIWKKYQLWFGYRSKPSYFLDQKVFNYLKRYNLLWCGISGKWHY